MRCTRLSSLLLAALLFVVPTGIARATSIVPLDLAELTRASDRIVYGTVLGSSSRWNEDRTLIVTDVRIRVVEDLKGRAPREITVTQPGGTVGKLMVEVPGAAAYRPGEEVVLFLAPERDGRTYVNGLDRGRYPVETDAATGEKRVVGLAVEELQAIQLAGARLDAGSFTTGAVPLERFLGGMRSFVRDLPVKGGN
jgi:hypothetical protein